jgi:hypothetical protein
MKYLQFTLLTFCMLAGWEARSQNSILYYGEVRDTVGAPLQFANVLAIDTITKKMSGFAVTNVEGQFKLRLDAQKTYQLKITFIGYAPFERYIQPKESNEQPLLFILNSNVTQLGVVEVVAEMPVTIQGDTITYKAEAFTQGNERKLEDVLEDLPGFQVEENGDIKVQGKKVDKVLIDGKEFFDGDSKLATKNIPANVVDRVQLLQNFNDIGPLRNVNGSEQLALNVELKDDKKKIVFGDLTVGAGPEKRYYGHANTFYYDEKTNLNLIADGNNIGELAFTMSDYFRFAGGLGSLLQRSGSGFNISSDQLGIPMAERNSAQSLDNQLGAFNFSLRPTYGWQVSGFAIGSLVDNSFGSVSNRTYLQEQSSLNETFTSGNFVDSQSGLGKLMLKYTPNYNLHVDYQLFGRKATTVNGSDQLSEVQQLSNQITGTQMQDPWAIEQKLSAFYALGDKDVLSMEASHKRQHQDPVYELYTSQQPFVGVIPLVADDRYGLRQSRVIDTENIEFLGNYYRILNRTNHINLSAGFNFQDQQYDARMFQEIDPQADEIEGDDFSNQVDFTFRDAFVGVLYKNKWGKLTWSPQVNLHHYDVSFSQVDGNGGFDRWMVLPGFNAKYDIRSSQNINFSYAVNANFMDVQKIATNLVINSYNSLSRGNAELMNSWFHSLSLNYRNFNLYSFFNIYGGANYQRKLDDIQSSYALNQWERVSLPINVLPVNEQASGYLNLEKRFDSFRTSLDANWSYSKINNELGDLANTNINVQQRYKGLFSTRLWERVSLRLTHEVTINQYEGNQNSNTFVNHESAVRINWKMVDGLRWITTYAYNNYQNKSTNTHSQYDLMDMTIRYRKEGSPWEFALKGMNVLNTTSIRRDSFSDNLISTYAYNIQQRYGIVTVMYDL